MNSYTFVQSRFFEPISSYTSADEYRDVLVELLPADWSIRRFDVWYGADPPSPKFQTQGFKIHVSATPETAEDVIRRVASVCVTKQTPFKIAADSKLLHYLNSKRMARGNAGKFMTIYPPDTDLFRDLIDQVYEATKGLVGPYILSDKRYKDSTIVFYRYGSFKSETLMNVEGYSRPMIYDGTGELMHDQRLPYFHLPEGITDPFPTEDDKQERDEEKTSLLDGRFDIQEAIVFSNSGGVYLAKDTREDQLVILKEARPFTNMWSAEDEVLDSVRILEREYELLKMLENTGAVVRPVSLFQAWEHTFLAEEYIDGMLLRHFRSNDHIILAPHIRNRDRVRRFCSAWRMVGLGIIGCVHAIHERGVIIGDLSPNNIMINPNSLSVRLIDFESAIIAGETQREQMRRWYTPGFRPHKASSEKNVTYGDDWYAVGMILFSMLIPVEAFIHFHPPAKDRFINRFVNNGLPRKIKYVIEHLMGGEIDEAENILRDWRSLDGETLEWNPSIFEEDIKEPIEKSTLNAIVD